ncbi:unnamed protein product [Paramecium primaurelia]|uniref:Uncharacterized protein n=1 Tax=Paramecium primaurelia TaxID=5886 RepID=A0A8S1QCW9_PARPR|nr:unnamed protein product [Paramecium primaurelia]
MSEEDLILNKMELQTYKITKDSNDKLKTQISENDEKIQKMKDLIEEIKQKNIEISQEFVNQNKEIENLGKEFQLIKNENDAQIYKLKDQLIKYEQRYSEQEKINENSIIQQQFKQPNRYFCDIQRSKDGRKEAKIVFDQSFKSKRLLTDIQQNSLNFIVYLENNEISHVIRQQIQLDSENNSIFQGNEVTVKIG